MAEITKEHDYKKVLPFDAVLRILAPAILPAAATVNTIT